MNESNLIKKSKKVFRDGYFYFVNSKIENLGFDLVITIDNKEYKVKKLLNLGQTIINSSSVEENLALFNTKAKNMLNEISGKYRNIPINYNIAVIEELCINPNYKEISDILNLDYLECLKYYRRDEDVLMDDHFNCLKGLELEFDRLPNILEKEGKDENYKQSLIYVIKNMEKIFGAKVPRH